MPILIANSFYSAAFLLAKCWIPCEAFVIRPIHGTMPAAGPQLSDGSGPFQVCVAGFPSPKICNPISDAVFFCGLYIACSGVDKAGVVEPIR
jgi:hypothetical protein